mmetsp:Transcript_76942/g.207567  ORF Transcript_76942/g.207567 Transcript_76942/m.207567 type:complete len:252 (-) Transcript_76942:122-877(-)
MAALRAVGSTALVVAGGLSGCRPSWAAGARPLATRSPLRSWAGPGARRREQRPPPPRVLVAGARARASPGGPGRRAELPGTSGGPVQRHESRNPVAGLAPVCLAYLLGIVATELIVFDLGAPRSAFWFYAASLPSLVAWPQALRILLPVLGVTAGLAVGGWRASAARRLEGDCRPRLRWYLLVAALLAGPGLISLVGAVAAARAFCVHWSYPLGLRRVLALNHLAEVRWWHLLMTLTLICCILAQHRAEAC